MVGHPSHSSSSLGSLVHPTAKPGFQAIATTVPTHQTCTNHPETLIRQRTHHVQALGAKEPHPSSDGVTRDACSQASAGLAAPKGSTTDRTSQTCTNHSETLIRHVPITCKLWE